jgi:hypothetical protein
MAKFNRYLGFALMLILGTSACGNESDLTGPWQMEVSLVCAGSPVHAVIPFEVVEDMTLSGSGQVDGTYKLRPPLICPEFREVNLVGIINIAGAYTNSGGTGFVIDLFDIQAGSEYDALSVCPGKPVDVIDKGIIAMDVGMFISAIKQGWNSRINITAIQEGNTKNAPDIKARDGAETVLQAGICNVNLLLHKRKTGSAPAKMAGFDPLWFDLRSLKFIPR